MRASIDINVSADVAARYGLTAADLFNLTIREVDATGATVTSEVFRNLSVKDSPGRVDKVLQAQSNLLNWDGAWPPNPLPTIAASDDDVTKAQAALAAAQAADPQVRSKRLAAGICSAKRRRRCRRHLRRSWGRTAWR